MFELFKKLDASAHVAHAVVINNSILFVYQDTKITLQATLVEGIYDVYEEGVYLEAMTEKEILGKFGGVEVVEK